MHMKLFISADIEGTAGTMAWPQTELNDPSWKEAAEEMTQEVRSACDGAGERGVKEIFVKDAHDSARNLNPLLLPENVRIMRGWTRGPASMVGGLDGTFGAAAMIGYHSACGTNGNPLAHTMNLGVEMATLNGKVMSEFTMHAYTCAWNRVPVIFVSGDRMICESAQELIPAITAVPVSEGLGNASTFLHPAVVRRRIQEGMRHALEGDVSRCLPKMPDHFEVTVRFREHYKAYRAAFYPGARADGMKGVAFEADDYFDIIRFLMFVL